MANVDNVTVGTIGGSDWSYDYAAPFYAHLDATVRPFSLWGAVLEDENLYLGDNYSEYVKNELMDYVSYTSAFSAELVKPCPKTFKITGPKLAFFKSGTTYTLHVNDNGTVRDALYSDFSIDGEPSKILCAAWHHATAIGILTPDGGSVWREGSETIFFEAEDLETNDGAIYTYLPYFENSENEIRYLASDNPDPTDFGGGWLGEAIVPVPEDLNTPGDNITGLGTDLGLYLASGPVRAFVCTDGELNDLATKIGEGWFANNIGDALISIKLIRTPGAVNTYDTQTIIPATSLSSTEVDGRYVKRQFQHFSFGSYDIPEQYGSFLDYTNTTVSLYLPFSGLHQLDAKTVMGGRITLDAFIDYISGSVIWYVTVLRDGVEQTIYEWSGNCSMEIPLTSIDYSQKITQLLSGVLTTASGIGSSNPMYAIGGVTQIAQAASNDYISIGNLSSNAGWTGIMYPFMIFHRTKTAYPADYNEMVGKPSMKQETLSSLTGFTKIYEIHLDNILATEDEKAELMALLKAGVIL